MRNEESVTHLLSILSNLEPKEALDLIREMYLFEPYSQSTRDNVKSLLDLIYVDKYLIICNKTNNVTSDIDKNIFNVTFTGRDGSQSLSVKPDNSEH